MPSRITTSLNIQYPIIQAAMTWLTSAKLVAAVSNAGGLGVLGPNAGQQEIAQNANESAERLRKEIHKTRALTDKPFAINFLLPTFGNSQSFDYAEALFKIIHEENIAIAVVVSLSTENDFSFIEQFKNIGVFVIYRDISPTVSHAITMEKMGIDAIIMTGYEAGGHLSQSPTSQSSLLAQTIGSVEIPVIAAGGIHNRQTVDTAFLAGADAVYMGTRFINTLENPASEFCKQAIINARSEDLIVITTDAGKVRLIANKDKNYSSNYRQTMLLGEQNGAFICVSESAGEIDDIVSCQTLIEDLMGISQHSDE